jgi:MFS family permease
MGLSQNVEAPPTRETLQNQKRNFRIVQIDAIGVGLASAAAPFLPVFLTRLHATATQIGLLTTMPGITGLLFAIPVGRFLQTRRNVVPWFSLARLLVISAYAATGIVPFFLSDEIAVIAILTIWAAVTLPQTIVAVAFSVVMNAVAGPSRRYELMSQRWSTLGLTSAITVAAAGQLLDWIDYPFNYQIVFLGLSIGGLISYYFSSRIQIPDSEPIPKSPEKHTPIQSIREYMDLIRGQPEFVSFALKRLVFLSGVTLAAPIFPLYYVRVVDAPDAWIGLFSTIHTGLMLVGYRLWTRQSRLRGSRFVLVLTTFGTSLFPLLVASTRQVELIAVFAGFAGIFQAGLDLVFFDELMRTVPIKYSATFVSLAQSLQHLSTILSPLVGTFIADHWSLQAALIISTGLRLIGFLLFLKPWKQQGLLDKEEEPIKV